LITDNLFLLLYIHSKFSIVTCKYTFLLKKFSLAYSLLVRISGSWGNSCPAFQREFKARNLSVLKIYAVWMIRKDIVACRPVAI
jgi:hypothetical protein